MSTFVQVFSLSFVSETPIILGTPSSLSTEYHSEKIIFLSDCVNCNEKEKIHVFFYFLICGPSTSSYNTSLTIVLCTLALSVL